MHVALCQPFTESLLSPGQLSQALSAGESRAMTRPSLSLSARTTLESHSQGTCVDRMHMHVYVHGCVCVWSVDCQLTVGYAKSNTPVQATKGAFWPGLNLLAYTTYAECVYVCVFCEKGQDRLA